MKPVTLPQEVISPEQLLIKVASILDGFGIKYFVTGGFAVSVWGRPRATFDIDIVVKLIEPQITPLARALKKISEAGYIDEDSAREAIAQKGEFNFIDPETGLKVDFWVIKGDLQSHLELERKKQIDIGSHKVYFISPEDLILSKLQWYQKSESSKQWEDVESIIKISGKKLDKKYLKKQAGLLGISENLGKLLKQERLK